MDNLTSQNEQLEEENRRLRELARKLAGLIKTEADERRRLLYAEGLLRGHSRRIQDMLEKSSPLLVKELREQINED